MGFTRTYCQVFCVFLSLLLASCGTRSVPRPYGYYRITMPDTVYIPFQAADYPYTFLLNSAAEVREHEADGEHYWIDIHYPALNADIHCSYKPVRSDLRMLTDDALEFVYKHTTVASAIPEREFTNPSAHVYGVLFTLEGNTATPCQFFLTDSIHHFFRGAVYCRCRPNRDSLAPVFDYLNRDVERLIESFQWK